MSDNSIEYEIVLKNCAFFAHHGVYAAEGELGQRFYVDARLTVKGSSSLSADSIDSVVDYGLLYNSLDRIVTGTNRRLIETLAHDIATCVCAEFPSIIRACITVRKPAAPVRGILDYVEVTLCHPQ